jgi:hypothetical protein
MRQLSGRNFRNCQDGRILITGILIYSPADNKAIYSAVPQNPEPKQLRVVLETPHAQQSVLANKETPEQLRLRSSTQDQNQAENP